MVGRGADDARSAPPIPIGSCASGTSRASPAGGPGAELTSAVETPLARALPVVSDFTGAPWQAERLAWRLLLLATVLFLGVVLGGWYAVRWYIGNAIVINQGFGQLDRGRRLHSAG